jgi:hypothetical protein
LVKLMTGMMGLIWNCSIGLAMIRSQKFAVANAVRRSKSKSVTVCRHAGRV